jgi:hypothetical protein
MPTQCHRKQEVLDILSLIQEILVKEGKDDNYPQW